MLRTFLLFFALLIAVKGNSQVFLEENFDNGLPSTFVVQNGGSTDLTWVGVNNYLESNAPKTLNGSPFLFCNGDPAGPGSSMDEYITTPSMNTLSANILTLQFTQYYRDYAGTDTDTGIVEVYDGSVWVRLASYQSNKGSWTTPNVARFNITQYRNSSMKIRFHFLGDWPWYWAIDNFKVFVPQPSDIGVTSVLTPASECGITPSLNLKVRISNFGTASQSNFPVAYSVNGGTPVIETCTSSVSSNNTKDFTFATPLNLSTPGAYKIKIWTLLTTDLDNSNDTLSDFLITRYENSIPSLTFDNYDGSNLPDVHPGWKEAKGKIPSGTTSLWTKGSALQQAYFGSITARVNLNSNQAREWMIGPSIKPLSNTGITFKAAITDWNGNTLDYMGQDDSLRIMVSTNCGQNWRAVFSINANTGLSNNLTKFIVPLAAYAGQEIRIAVFATDGNFDGEEDYDIHIDNFSVESLPAGDIGVSAIKSPASNCGLGVSPVTVQVRNFGFSTQRNFQVYYKFDNQTVVSELFSDSIKPNQVKDFTFSQTANIAALGVYKFSAWTALPGDPNKFNDSTKNVMVENSLAITNYPYLESFENGAGGWKSGGSLSSWELGTPQKTIISSPADGNFSWVTGGASTGTYNSNEKSFVIGPCFNFTNLVNPIIEMKVWWHSDYEKDGAVLQYSINGGTNWANVGQVGDPNNWFNTTTIPALSFPPISAIPQMGWSGGVGTNQNGSGGWVTIRNFVKLAAGEPVVKFRVCFGANSSVNGDGFAFDRVSIYEGPTKDAELNGIVSPALSNCAFGPAFPIKVKLSNKGSQPITNVPISYQINNLPPVNEVITSSIDSNQTVEYTFNQTFDFSNPGTYNVRCWTALSGDDILYNDSILVHRVAVYSNGLDTLKFDSYSGSNLSIVYPGYREARKYTPEGELSNWTRSNPAQTAFFSGATAKLNLVSNFSKEWLISPQFTCEPTTRLSFRMAITKGNDILPQNLGQDDSVLVRISTNCGASWTTLRYFNRDSVFTNSFRNFRISLAAYAGQKVIIGFYGSDGAIDNPEDADIHISKVLVLPSPANDMAMAGLVSPVQSCGLGAAEVIKVKVFNNGAASQNAYKIGYQVNNNVPVIEDITTPIASGAEVEYSFNQTVNFTQPGIYRIKVWTKLTTDAVSVNDSSSFTIRKYGTPTATLAFTGFGGSNLTEVSNDWSEAVGNPPQRGNSKWSALTIGSNIVARIPIAGGNISEWLVSPVVKLGEGSVVRFRAAVRLPGTNLDGTLDSDDKIMVLATSNCGQTWDTLKIFTDTTQPALTAALDPLEVSLSAYDNQEVRIAFYATDGVRADLVSDFLLDDVKLVSTASLTDIGVLNLLSPGAEMVVGNPNLVKVRIKNFGNTLISSQALLMASVGESNYSIYLEESIPVGGIRDVLLGEYIPEEEGTVIACAYIQLLPEGDVEALNDTLCTQITITSSEGNILENPVYAFPVPARRDLFVRTSLIATSDELILTNTAGIRLPLSFRKEKEGLYYLNMESLPAGMYFLFGADKSRTPLKLVKE
jgi:hypothetical protein